MVIVGAKTVIYNVPKPTADRAREQSEGAYFRWIRTAIPKKKGTKPSKKIFSPAEKIDEDPNAPAVFFGGAASDFQQIKAATRNFHPDNKLGEGGFGAVYKGVLPNKMEIAVKRLSSKSRQGNREFINEAGTISGLNHPNVVRLLGCCSENKQLLLVYEYMENNSLGKALFGPANFKSRLNWETRIKICIGIAKGAAFLYEESGLRIVHRDIKPTNVLLDKYLNPKISDFGLAKVDEEEDTHISTRIAGTLGYMAPEYAMRGYLTSKADVYSFGVVMLEIVSGKKNMDYLANDDKVYLLDLAYDLQEKGKLIELIDPDLKMTDYSLKEATRVFDLAIRCTHFSPTFRPTMSEVVSILEGKTEMKSASQHGSVDDSRKANASSAAYSLSTHSGSTCTDENSKKEPIVIGDDGDDDASDLEDVAPTIVSTHDQLPSRKEEEEEKEDNAAVLDELDVVNSIYKVNDDQYISDQAIEEGGKDDGAIQGNVSITSESLKSNARSWASARFMDHATKTVEDKDKLEYVEPCFDEDGKLHIECSEEELETGCNEWKNSLVGCFVGDDTPPLINTIVNKENVETLWGVKEEAISMIPMENGYVVFQFKNAEDKIKVLESGPWYFEHIPLVLREWDWKLNYDKADDEIKTLPIWVKIYNLPLFLWSSSFLSKVASGLGTPLYSDQETKRKKRLDFARLCIEVDASKPLPESLNITVKGINYKIKFKYDWKPLRCATCCTFGHKESVCARFKDERNKSELIQI